MKTIPCATPLPLIFLKRVLIFAISRNFGDIPAVLWAGRGIKCMKFVEIRFILRHIALNLLKKDKVTKAGIAARRKKAGMG